MTQYNELTAAFAIAMPSEDDDDDLDAPDAPSSFMASPSTLQSWLVALSEQVSRLDSSYATLIDNILLLPWTTMSESFARTWVNFVYHLVSARGEWLYPVLKRAVKTLSYRTDWRALALAEMSRSTGSDAAGPQGMATRRLMYDRTHGLLRRLLAVVPTLTFSLEAMLRKYFPPKRDSALVQLVYIRNALRVCEYCPELSDSVLNLVIGRALQTDVEIQVELDELEDETGAAFGSDDEDDPLDHAIDQVDTSDDDDDDEDEDEFEGDEQVSTDNEAASDQDSGEADQAQSVVRVRKLVDKLDQVMKALFDHLNSRNRMMGQLANRQAHTDSRDPRPALFASLLSIFNRSILPTFKSRHVQFLLFWFSSLDADYVDLFLGSLLSTALHWVVAGPESKDEPPIIRLAAASYAASFVSRAKFVHAPICRDVMTNLCAFLEGHLADAALPDTSLFEAPPGAPAHHPFYSVSQAAFYIFCFRWRDLRTREESYGASLPSGMGSPDAQVAFSMSSMGSAADGAQAARMEGDGHGSWMPSLAVLTRAVTSPLNPLRFCAPAIVQQFAHVAQYSGFFYCFSILEANKRVATRDADTGPKETASMGLSDAFFPFDPFRLPKSGRFIDPLYREWSEVAPDDTDDEEADDAVGFGDDASSRSSPIAVPASVPPKPSADWSSSLDLESMSIESH